jgi:hypothetical protein
VVKKLWLRIGESEMKCNLTQVIIALNENKKLKFKNGEFTLWVNKCGYLMLTDSLGHNRYLNNIHISDEWELIKEPVTFMDALKAYCEGKKIKVQCSDYSDCFIRESNEYDTFLRVPPTVILKGKWYIED